MADSEQTTYWEWIITDDQNGRYLWTTITTVQDVQALSQEISLRSVLETAMPASISTFFDDDPDTYDADQLVSIVESEFTSGQG